MLPSYLLTITQVDGLQEDLNMTNGQYNAALSLFFVTGGSALDGISPLR